MRILLAEDAALLRDGLVAVLERADHEVVAAVPTATELRAEAKRLLDAQAVDLVITDVRMPPGHGDDGLQAALAIRRDHPRTPAIVLSQYAEPGYADLLLRDADPGGQAGGLGYLLKDRVSRIHDFLDALEVVRGGGIVIDPMLVSLLMRRERSDLSRLSAREQEVLQLVSQGLTNDQISAQLHLSRGAVVKHVSAVFDKLHISEQDGNRRVLAAIAYLREHPS